MVRWQMRRRIEGIFFAERYTFVINRDKFRTACTLLRIEKVDFFHFHENVTEASQQPFRVLRKLNTELKNVVLRICNEPS